MLISIHGLAKAYRRRRVLNDVSFDVPAGLLVGVQGENGAGKSTLLKCVVGLLKPDAGEVRVDGRMGYCPQDPSLLTMLTAHEHLQLFGAGLGLSPRETDMRAAELMEHFGCTKFADTRIEAMSGGTAQKINLIGSLLHAPDVLVLDEPYQGFDHDTYVRFWDYAESSRSRGGSVLVVSHMHSEIERFDALIDLVDGRAQAGGPQAHRVMHEPAGAR